MNISMRILFFTMLIISVQSVNGQVFYDKVFYNHHGTACAKEDSTGNIIVSFPEDSTLTKFDSLFYPVWSKTNDSHIYLFEILKSGNLISGGYKLVGGLVTPYFALLDPLGDTLWSQMPIITSSNYQKIVSDLKIDRTGKYIYLVSMDRQPPYPDQIIKFDSAGILNGGFSVYGDEFSYNIGYNNRIITAASIWNPVGPSTCDINAYDSTLSHLWLTSLIDTISNPHTYRPDLVFPTTSPTTIVSGHWDWYYALFEMGVNGTLDNTNYCNDYGDLINVIEVSAGGYLCIGKTYGNTGYALRLGSGATQNWYVEFNGINVVTPLFLQEVHDGFIVSGSTLDSNSHNIPWMTKIELNGPMTTSIYEKNSDESFQVHAEDHMIKIYQSKGNKLVLFDMFGRVVKILDHLSDSYSFEFSEASGIYICTLYKDNQFIASKRVMID